ncbi:hypothetical protein [Nostoc sp.]|uniref:hypothetical protein n=1 Tax=Nostoc sp. TaxID=1180 RepID=UPI002FF457CA
MCETLKEFLELIVFAKPSEKTKLIIKVSSTHPRKLAKVLLKLYLFMGLAIACSNSSVIAVNRYESYSINYLCLHSVGVVRVRSPLTVGIYAWT